MVVARQLLSMNESTGEIVPVEPISIRGSEGMAIQLAKCCRPIPGDPIIGIINKGQGMVIHTHDCTAISKTRHEADKWLDVEWSGDSTKLFDVNVEIVVENNRGVLAKVASEMAEAGSNIDHVAMDPNDGGTYMTIHFTIQVSNRQHLSKVMQNLRRIPEVIRVARTTN